LLSRVPGTASAGKGRFFADLLGFSDDSLAAALTAHLADNLSAATIDNDRMVIDAPLVGPSGRTAIVRSAWQRLPDGSISFITACPGKVQ
jgi:hypothetical protein